MGRNARPPETPALIYTPQQYADLVARGIDPGVMLNDDRIEHTVGREPPEFEPQRRVTHATHTR